MPSRVRLLENFCKKLKNSKNIEKDILKASDEEIIAIIQFLFNLKCSNVPLFKKEIKQLSKFKQEIEDLSKIRHVTAARNNLKQHGGSLLPLLIPSAIALAQILMSK